MRDCYHRYVEYIQNKDHALVLGTPGIGKTMLLYYCIYLFARDNDDMQIELRLRGQGINDPSHIFYLIKNAQGHRVRAVKDFVGKPMFILSDSVDITCLHQASKFTMAVASDSIKLCKTFNNIVGLDTAKGAKYYLPLVTLDELTVMIPNVDPNHLRLRYDVFGGSVRICRDCGVNQLSKDGEGLSITSAFITPVVTDFFNIHISNNVKGIVQKLCKSLNGLFGESDQASLITRSVFRHQFNFNNLGLGDFAFCSKFMKYLVGRVIKENQGTSIETKIKAIFGDAGFGIAFESSAFDTLLKETMTENGRDYSFINLRTGGEERIRVRVVRKVLIRNVADIASLNDGDIGIPLIGNFPLVDAIIKTATHFLMLQMTISLSHGGAVKQLKAIISSAGMRTKWFVHVVPFQNLRDFTPNDNLGCVQMVTAPEPTARKGILGKRKL